MYYNNCCNWYSNVLCGIENLIRLVKAQGTGNGPEILEALENINCSMETLNCLIETISCSVSSLNSGQQQLYATLAGNNPMSVAAEYPSEEEGKLVYVTEKVRFLDMLNPKLIVLFKGTLDNEDPVYFSDTSGYQHVVCLREPSHQAKANELENNKPYPALYIGNYIILEPSEGTENSRAFGIL